MTKKQQIILNLSVVLIVLLMISGLLTWLTTYIPRSFRSAEPKEEVNLNVQLVDEEQAYENEMNIEDSSQQPPVEGYHDEAFDNLVEEPNSPLESPPLEPTQVVAIQPDSLSSELESSPPSEPDISWAQFEQSLIQLEQERAKIIAMIKQNSVSKEKSESTTGVDDRLESVPQQKISWSEFNETFLALEKIRNKTIEMIKQNTSPYENPMLMPKDSELNWVIVGQQIVTLEEQWKEILF